MPTHAVRLAKCAIAAVRSSDGGDVTVSYALRAVLESTVKEVRRQWRRRRVEAVAAGLGSAAAAASAHPPRPTLYPLLRRVCCRLLQPDVVRLQRAGLARLELHAGNGGGASSSGVGGAGAGNGGGAGDGAGAGGSGAGSSSGASEEVAAQRQVDGQAEEEGEEVGREVHGGAQGSPRGWAVTAHEAAMGTLQLKSFRELEGLHMCAIHSSLGVWRLLHTHRLWRFLPGRPGPGVLPTVYDTARLSAAAALAMQRMLYGEGSDIISGWRWASQATAPPAAALPYARIAALPRAVTFLTWPGVG